MRSCSCRHTSFVLVRGPSLSVFQHLVFELTETDFRESALYDVPSCTDASLNCIVVGGHIMCLFENIVHLFFVHYTVKWAANYAVEVTC